MKTHWFHILLALSNEDLHGSGIVRAVLEQTQGSLQLWPATLYGSLDELSGHGWIQELGPGEHPEGESERKRFYRITDAGAQKLSSEAERLESLARAALDSRALRALSG